MSTQRHLFTSESVSEGHPDKVADLISDRILDACLAQDPKSRVACETLCKGSHVVIAGEITTSAGVVIEPVVRDTITAIGYNDPSEPFTAERVEVTSLLTKQASEIGEAVSRSADDPATLGAGDQGMMVGFACDETAAMMPLPIHLAHRITERLAENRKAGRVAWLRPDAKSQVSVEYEGNTPVAVKTVLVSTQHAPGIPGDEIEQYVRAELLPAVLGEWFTPQVEVLSNPSGSFIEGGPSADCGLTGRKIIVDTYGGMARHGGGAFSGKDATKVDRSGAYFCRFVARQVVAAGLASRVELQVAYAIGRSRPVSLRAETFGTGDERQVAEYVEKFDFRPGAIIERLGLTRPVFSRSTNYGHFGRPGLPWEESH